MNKEPYDMYMVYLENVITLLINSVKSRIFVFYVL